MKRSSKLLSWKTRGVNLLPKLGYPSTLPLLPSFPSPPLPHSHPPPLLYCSPSLMAGDSEPKFFFELQMLVGEF
jgi:hypothetical protein